MFDTNNKPFGLNNKLIRKNLSKSLPKPLLITSLKHNQEIDLNKLKFDDYYVLLISFNEFSREILQEWIIKLSKDQSNLNIIEISVASKWYIKFISSILRNKLKKTLNKEQQDYFYHKWTNFTNVEREILDIDNPLAGYLYLIDKDNKIRAKTTGGIENDDEYKIFKFYC